MYTIGQISDMFNIPISTLRYYDKEGLFLIYSAAPAFASSATGRWKSSA